MSWRLSDNGNTNNNNRNNNRSENKSRSRSPYNLRPLKPVDYRATNNQGTTADERSASRSSRRSSKSRRRSSTRTTGRSRASTTRPSRSRNTSVSRNSNQLTLVDVVEEEGETDGDPDYEGCEVVDKTQSTIFTATDKGFYPINFTEQEVMEALSNQGTLGSSAYEAATHTFDNVGGLGETIDVVRTTIRFPLVCPEFFTQFQIKPNRGLIFYGPPGVGKTMMARALVDCCKRYTNRKIAFFLRKGSDILNPYVGQSEANLIKLFDAAKQLSPSIIFLDEIDALAPVRTRNENSRVETNVVSTLLALMDGLEDRGMVFVIGATNRLEAIDPALRRPGRFDLEISFQLPDREARKDILSKVTSTWGIRPSIIDTVAGRTSGFSGADLANLCKTAAFKALERTNPGVVTDDDDNWQPINLASITVKMEDFDAAMHIIQPTNQRLQNN